MIADTVNLWSIGVPSDVCIMHLEDRLSEIVSKAAMLRGTSHTKTRLDVYLTAICFYNPEHIRSEYQRTLSTFLTLETVLPAFQLSEGDVPLLIAVITQIDSTLQIEEDEGRVFVRSLTA